MDSSSGERNLKRKSNGLALESNGWALMRKMGWAEGKGLGAQEQGRVEPVQAKMLKSRSGLGVDSRVNFRSLSVGETPNGAHAWCEERRPERETKDDDMVFPWSHWGAADGAEGESEREWTPPEDVEIRGILSTEMLSPSSESALGPPIEHLESENKYCSDELLLEMLFYKNSLDNRSREAIASARARSNPYENTRNGIFMNRAAMKMANLDVLLDGILSRAAPPGEMLYFADVCAGPGGFSEYLTWRRGHPLVPFHASSGVGTFPRVRGFGMTLRGPCDFKLNKFVAGPVETFRAYYGPSAGCDGDITSWTNLAGFSNLVARHTLGQGVHVVMADGGFDVSDGFNLQEVKSKHIYLCQCLCALSILRPGGVFVTKLFDTFTDFTVDLIYLMSRVFKCVRLVKPVSSRPANSERYLVCEALIAPRMVGCPSPSTPPASASRNSSHERSSRPLFKSKQRTQQLQQQQQQQQQQQHHQYAIDEDSAVALLVKHFIAVSEELHKLSHTGHLPTAPSGDSANHLDVLRLANIPANLHGLSFGRFITRANETIIRRQCIYLSKMIVFADNAEKQEAEAQEELKEALLAKWQIPSVGRQDSTAWPLWPANIPHTLRAFAASQHPSRGPRLVKLPRQYLRSSLVAMSAEDAIRSDFNACAHLGVVIGDLHTTRPGGPPNEPFMVYSGDKSTGLLESHDGKYWRKADFPEGAGPPLPPGTLVWGFKVNLYSEDGLRLQALMVLDAAFIYGTDIHALSYTQRLREIDVLCDTLDCADITGVKLVAPKYFPLNNLGHFMQTLAPRSCKDAIHEGGMFKATASGAFCAPRHLLVVKHLVSPWICQRSRSTGRLYYVDLHDPLASSTFVLPRDVGLPFHKTFFLRVPWKGYGVEFDVQALAQKVSNSAGRTDCGAQRNMNSSHLNH